MMTSAAFLDSALCGQAVTYQDKSVNEWVNELRPTSETGPAKAREALRHLGTNAVPSLLVQLDELADTYGTNVAAFPAASAQCLLLLDAFRAVGTNGRPAIGEVERLFEQRAISPDRLADVLMAIDTNEAATVFARELMNRSLEVRVASARHLHDGIGTNTEVALRAFIECLNYESTDAANARELRIAAAGHLGSLGLSNHPEAVAALVNRFPRETNEIVRIVILQSLGRLGTNGQSAIPLLRQATNDPVPIVAKSAIDALIAIDGHKLNDKRSP
jgi:HEAT repeat protein